MKLRKFGAVGGIPSRSTNVHGVESGADFEQSVVDSDER